MRVAERLAAGCISLRHLVLARHVHRHGARLRQRARSGLSSAAPPSCPAGGVRLASVPLRRSMNTWNTSAV